MYIYMSTCMHVFFPLKFCETKVNFATYSQLHRHLLSQKIPAAKKNFWRSNILDIFNFMIYLFLWFLGCFLFGWRRNIKNLPIKSNELDDVNTYAVCSLLLPGLNTMVFLSRIMQILKKDQRRILGERYGCSRWGGTAGLQYTPTFRSRRFSGREPVAGRQGSSGVGRNSAPRRGGCGLGWQRVWGLQVDSD